MTSGLHESKAAKVTRRQHLLQLASLEIVAAEAARVAAPGDPRVQRRVRIAQSRKDAAAMDLQLATDLP